MFKQSGIYSFANLPVIVTDSKNHVSTQEDTTEWVKTAVMASGGAMLVNTTGSVETIREFGLDVKRELSDAGGPTIVIDLSAVDILTPEELVGLLYHEAGHAKLHMHGVEESPEKEIDADNYAISKGVSRAVMGSMLTKLIKSVGVTQLQAQGLTEKEAGIHIAGMLATEPSYLARMANFAA